MTDFRGAPRAVPEDLARRAMSDCGIDPAPHVVADARLFSDKIPDTIGHVGAHAKFLRAIEGDPRFPSFIRGIRDKIHAVENSGDFAGQCTSACSAALAKFDLWASL